MASSEEDEQLIGELEDHDELHSSLLHHHLSQSSFEKKTIAEAESQVSKKPYPLDARNLELSSKFSKLKRKRLMNSVEKTKVSSAKRPKDTIPNVSLGDTTEFILDTSDVHETFRCPSVLWEKLYDFQKTGLKFLLSKYVQNTGGLLADEMGLGKSIQVVAFLACLGATYGRLTEPVLLICPTTLVSHWEDEIAKWVSPSLVRSHRLVESSNCFSENACVQVGLISYEMFRTRHSSLSRQAYSVTVLDEAQRIRNPDAKITIAVKQLNCYCRIALSGSPIQNNLSELWSIFDFVAPGRLGTLPTFQEELAEPIEQGTRPRASLSDVQLSHRCAIIVRDLTSPLMIRRLKADFAQELELADKEEQVLFCQLSQDQIELYCKFLATDTVNDAMRIDKKSRDMGKTFYAISVLRKICNHPDLLLSDIRDVDDYGHCSRSGKLAVLIPLLRLWKKQGKRCLIFSQSLGMLDILQSTLRDLHISFARMDGSTPVNVRSSIVDEFDSSKTRQNRSNSVMCLLLSTRVGGVGLNLTCAERVVIFDPDWNPMTDAQARERSWRIGQKKHVKIYRLIAAESVEEIICKRQIFKQYLAQKILTDPRQGKVADYDNLFDLFKPPKQLSIVSKSRSKTVSKLMELVSKPQLIMEDTNELDGNINEEDQLSSLITKVWNQDEIEMPKLNPALVDSNETEAAAGRAIRAVLAEANEGKHNITVPTWTGKSGGTVYTAKDRSTSLISKIRGGPNVGSSMIKKTTFEAEQLIVEKAVVKDLISFFKKRKDYSSTSEEVLTALSSKIESGHSEIFRSCLRQLCDFHDDGVWVLKLDHR